jgi:hypothetical protein
VAASEPVSVYQTLSNRACAVVEDGMKRAGQDYLVYRCKGAAGTPVWLAYSDSTRLSIGLGRKRNFAGVYSAGRDRSWPLEWRGDLRSGAFRPFAVILRVSDPASSESRLVVYGLTRDGSSSCILGEARGTDAGVAARRIADARRGCG